MTQAAARRHQLPLQTVLSITENGTEVSSQTPAMTISKDTCWLLLRLAILLGVLLVQLSEGATYQDFANRHIDSPKARTPNSNAYCNLMMQRRNLNPRQCKPINTFINNKPSDIQRICRRGGTHYQRNLYDSKRRFRVVVCRSRGRFPNCNYVGKKETKRLRVACVNNLPVHFERLLP